MAARISEVGRVMALYRYPVKSMAGTALHETRIGWHGVDGDRRYAWVQSDNRTNFPWLTARQIAEMLRYQPELGQPADPVRSPVLVRTPGGATLPIGSDELRLELAARFSGPINLMQIGHGTHDSGPGVSIMSRSSVRDLCRAAQVAEDERRFRQNIMLEAYEDTPFLEESWLGSTLIFGDRADAVRVQLQRPIVRCMIVNLDPDTAVQNGRVLRAISNLHENHAGVYGGVRAVGTLRVGDVVRLAHDV